jgi:hypothetical protein
MNIDQTNNGIRLNLEPGTLIFKTVAMELMAPSNEEIPAKCRLKIARSTEPSETIVLRGGYTVQPVPTPAPTILELTNKIKDGGNNQKLKLLRRGKAISGAPIINGKIRLPKPPIIAGITIKKIIIKACAVTMTL